MLKGLEIMCSLICSFRVVYIAQKFSPRAYTAPQMEHFSKRYLPNSKQASPKPIQTTALSIKEAWAHWRELLSEVLE